MTKLLAQIDRVAASETRVCILGETGTGKELVARAIHEKSPRRENAFITLNCAAVPAELIESELFGHEKGAFTGAAAKHLGKFEQADGGTLFLDEIGDMPVAMQAKLLRVLEEGEVERVGGDKPIRVNVRVVVATHRNLEDLVKQNTFRRDLFHRIYVFPLGAAAAARAPGRFSRRWSSISRGKWRRRTAGKKKSSQGCHRRTAPLQLARQRSRTAQRGRTAGASCGTKTGRCCGRAVGSCLVDVARRAAIGPFDAEPGTLAERTEQFEREVLLAEIHRHNFHMTNVARAMGLERSHLYKKCQQLGIDLQSIRKPE